MIYKQWPGRVFVNRADFMEYLGLSLMVLYQGQDRKRSQTWCKSAGTFLYAECL